MTRIDIEIIKQDLGHYLELVEQGETVLITREKKVMAELKPLKNKIENSRPSGLCKGEFTVPDNFDDPLPDHLLAGFEGE